MIEVNLFNCVNRVFLLCPPLRKQFYEYLDALYVASTSKLKLNFLKDCVKGKVLTSFLDSGYYAKCIQRTVSDAGSFIAQR